MKRITTEKNKIKELASELRLIRNLLIPLFTFEGSFAFTNQKFALLRKRGI